MIADTCFWIAAFDRKDQYHEKAVEVLESVRRSRLLMPWPIMYEVLRTQTVKSPWMVAAFERVIQEKTTRVDDTKYRDDCLNHTLSMGKASKRAISLVDMVVRAVIDDSENQISHLLTFNAGDFCDVCRVRGVPMWPEVPLLDEGTEGNGEDTG